MKGIEIRLQDKVEVLKERCQGRIIDFFQIGNRSKRAIIESSGGDVYSFDINQYGIEFVLASKSKQKTA